MTVSVLTMLDMWRPVSGGVIAEGDEFERVRVTLGVPHAVQAAALGEDRDAGTNRNLSARLRPKSVDVRGRIDQRIGRVYCGVVAVTDIGDPLALDEVIQLFR